MDNNDDNKTIKLGLNLEPDSDTKSGKTQPSKINNNNNNNTSSNKPAQKTDEKSHLSKNKDDENSTVNFSKSENQILSNDPNPPTSNKSNSSKNNTNTKSDKPDQYRSQSPSQISQKEHQIEKETLIQEEEPQKSDKPSIESNSHHLSESNEDTTQDTNTTQDDRKSQYLNATFQNIHDLDKGKESYRLSSMSPLKTVCFLSIGPVINQIFLAIESFVETIWVSKAIGKDGLSAVSSYAPFDSISLAFGLTASYAGSCAISGIIATNKTDKKEASQVIVDLLRVCLIVGIIIPSVLTPLAEKTVRWFGTSEKITKLGFKYILPILICTFITCMFLALTGFIEGEGRPILFSLITVLVSVSNIAILCPLFLLGFKVGIVGAGISRVLSRAIPLVILLIFYFKGAFTFKPKFNQFIKKFSPLTMGALKACLSQGFANLIAVIPSILIRKILGKMSVEKDNNYDDIISSYQTVTKYSQLFDKIVLGFAAGYLPVASYAYNKNDFKRWLFLTLHVNWICFAWCTFTVILTFAIPRKLAAAFLKDEIYLKIAGPMIRNSNCGGFFAFVQYTVGHLLRSIKMGFMAAVIGTLVHVAGLSVFAIILYKTNKKNTTRLMYSYPLANLLGLVVAGAFIAYPCYKFYKEWKFNEKNGLDSNHADKESEVHLNRAAVSHINVLN